MSSDQPGRAEDIDVHPEFADSSDSVLAVSIARFSQEALAETYRRHAGAVFGLAKRLLTDNARAEESCRMCSSACGTSRTVSIRTAERCAASSSPTPTVAPSTWSERMSARRCSALELADFGGMSYCDVLKRLGEAEGTIKSRIRSGSRKLRIELCRSGVTIGPAER